MDGRHDVTSVDRPYRPADWLRALARQQVVPFPWRPSLRAAICVALPLAAGLAAGQVPASLWIAMATLTIAGGEGSGTYRSRFRQMAISTPLAACGLFAGYLAVLPYPAVIAAMTFLAFLAGLINSFGAAWSIGTMQFHPESQHRQGSGHQHR